ncbi:MAG: hypothetical protein DRQ44_00790 [Gammaproteobacteria bacterium]|nr:MAG: hypothetical protein DRQ44_00790 [Gammaproteobacteria bacterium]
MLIIYGTDQTMMNLKTVLISLTLLVLASPVQAKEILTIETDEADIEVRIFPAEGNVLLLGFPCDEGKSIAEEKTAISLAEDGIEVWMPDMLSGFMLPKVRSSLAGISTDTLTAIIDEAIKTGKKVYLIASGPDTALVLRAASQWEAVGKNSENKQLAGAVLMFPRLFKATPVPGKIPEYIDAVGKTRLPIMLLEGGRTPNRWGINTLSQELQNSGSKVTAKVIPKVRGYFFKRQDANRSEDVVTSQMAGLIKVSLFYLEEN